MTSPLPAPLLIALLLIPATALGATPQDTSALQFGGFRPGVRLGELDAFMRPRGGGRLRCERAKGDLRVSECRGIVRDSAAGALKVWVSAMDSVAGVITLSAVVDSSALRGWRRDLERRYGRVAAKKQGSQSMLQWVRRGRMIRLTWRVERGELLASVSLVDGRVLDSWGAGRSAGHRSRMRKLPSPSSSR
jgi:hypothetical protein